MNPLTTSRAHRRSTRLRLVAHRGQSATHPENTVPAIAAAIAWGADAIAVDVRPTRDGELVLMHDRSPLRTTDIDVVRPEAVGLPVEALTLADLARLDAGAWKSEEFVGTPVPTLRDVFAFLRNRPAALVLDVQTTSIDASVVVERLLSTIGNRRQVTVVSRDREILTAVHDQSPRTRTGLVLTGAPSPGDIATFGEFHLDGRVVSRALVERIHRVGGHVIARHLFDADLTRRAVESGVDALCVEDVTARSASVWR